LLWLVWLLYGGEVVGGRSRRGGFAIRCFATNRIARDAGAFVAVAVLALAGLADTGRHTVQRGETLAEIAREHGVSISALAEANGLDDPNLVVAGTVLTIPGATGASGGGTYAVRPGDTLASIARRFGTTVQTVAAANGIANVNKVVAGSTLTIPGASGTAPTNAGAGAGGATYTVASGDTLASIARRFATTVTALSQANGIANPNRIVIGKVLTVPAAPAALSGPAEGHVVQAGESLASIAARYGVSVEALAQANGIMAPYRIYTGTRLLFSALNAAALPASIQCPVPGGRFFNDWGFPRSGGRFHTGNDLFAPRGTPVLAPATGSVTTVTGAIGGHQFVLHADDGTAYIGSHLDSFGETGRVAAGSVIGYVGDSGNAAGSSPHLHFEVQPAGGRSVNPYPLLAASC
jgi:LysM repeat protein